MGVGRRNVVGRRRHWKPMTMQEDSKDLSLYGRSMRQLLRCFFLMALSASIPALAQERDATTEQKRKSAENTARGDNESLADRIRSVERKVFLKRRRFELYPYAGMDLNDAFFQHFFLGGGVAYHFQDSFGLELRGGATIAEIEKDSVRFVRVTSGALPQEEALSLVAHGDLNATWAPVYGKFSLFSESIVHFDAFLSLGGGVFLTERGERETEDALVEQVTSVNPAVNIGIGLRNYINEWLVFRLEVRNYSFIEVGLSDLQNITMFNISISGFFPTTFAYEYQ
ncbi:MAG: outer membrane beta-barrel domain-containing protein [Myxococcales bacterium]|nr:outer membrane beta-barrel domain-containing protein [Myxococcales bacterium]